MNINTEVPDMYTHLITDEAFRKHVCERIDYILEETKDKYFTDLSMVIWVAQQTKSVVAYSESKGEYLFSFVGV